MIYLDHAATTPLDKRVLEAMTPYFCEQFGNASSQHSLGRTAANAVTEARDFIARTVGCHADEIYFTSGGTEADNWALRGIYAATKGHIVLSAIEHPAMINCAKQLQKEGANLTLVFPDKSGVVSAQSIEAAMRPDTVFVGVMSANNETGVLQPVKQIAALCAQRGVFFYSDCVQSAGVLPFDIENVGGIGFSAHKFYGPKGVGVLYLKRGTPIGRLIIGGMQERGMRGGTTPVANIVGCAKALELAVTDREMKERYVALVRNRFEEKIFASLKGVTVNGTAPRLPAHSNLCFEGCEGEQILMLADMLGIAISTGSACAAGAVTPSHVLTAMGLSEEQSRSSVRFSFGKDNTLYQAEQAAGIIIKIVNKIRG